MGTIRISFVYSIILLFAYSFIMKLVIHTDGGARGNPGPAAVGVVIEEAFSHQQSAIGQKSPGNNKLKAESRKLIAELGVRIGETTNNVAEYTAVIEALEGVMRHVSGVRNSEDVNIDFYLDSLLVVQQLNGVFKIKDMRLRELSLKIRILETGVGGEIRYHHVRREENSRADYLVNQALDNT